MSSPLITVENLGKNYRIRHEQVGGRRYKALRDVLADTTKSIAQRVWSVVRAAPHPAVRTPRSEVFWALRDVSFEVRQGEVLGIIGRNGAGKSTLLKILSRITEPSEGRVHIRGRVASLLEVGTGFHPELTGRENIFLNGAILGMCRNEIKTKFDDIVSFAEVEKFLDTPVKRYSSGMYVRLAFAVAAHLEPEILIVDEVLAVGDAEFQKKCLGKMESVAQKEGRTVLLVSHTLPVIRRLSSRALLLSRGRLQSCGPAESVVGDYGSSCVGNGRSGKYTAVASPTRACFTSLEVCTSDGGGLHRLGAPLRLLFEVHCPTPQEHLWLSAKILAQDGTVASFVCYMEPAGKGRHHWLGALACGKHRFACGLSTFPGYMGDYSLQAMLFNEQTGAVVDLVENVCSFSAYVPSDLVPGGDWHRNLCSFLVPFTWTRC